MLEKGSVQESLELIQDRRERRLKSQPLNYPSAGSVFRNPSKESPAGKLIEEASLKGYRLGGAEVSRLHANFIINVDKKELKKQIMLNLTNYYQMICNISFLHTIVVQ